MACELSDLSLAIQLRLYQIKNCVRLLFWGDQSFDEENLTKEGIFKTSDIRFPHKEEINISDIERWLQKAAIIQWDYKNLIKRKGVLIQL